MELNTSLHSPLTQTASLRNVGNGNAKTSNNQQQTGIEEPTNNKKNIRSINNNAGIDRVEQVNKNTKLNPGRIIQDDQPSRSRVIRENENDVRELKPLVIDQPTSPATRAFLEVADSNSDFRLIDIYV